VAELSPSGVANELESVATRKAGPLPVWGWAALGVILFAGITIVRRRRFAGAASSAATPTPTAQADTWMPSTAGLAQGYVPSTDETTAATAAIYSNADWRRAAGKALARTHTDNTTVARRLLDYLKGGTFPTGEYQGIVATAEEAIQAVGPPPEPTGYLFEADSSTPAPQQGVGPAPGQTPTSIPEPTPTAPQPAMNNGQPSFFRVGVLGSIYDAAEYYYGDRNAWDRFYLDPGETGNPRGWINPQSVNEVQSDWILAADPTGRLRD